MTIYILDFIELVAGFPYRAILELISRNVTRQLSLVNEFKCDGIKCYSLVEVHVLFHERDNSISLTEQSTKVHITASTVLLGIKERSSAVPMINSLKQTLLNSDSSLFQVFIKVAIRVNTYKICSFRYVFKVCSTTNTYF